MRKGDAAKLYCWNYYILTFVGCVAGATKEVRDYHLKSVEEQGHESVATCCGDM
jgi:hypothetical protein